MTHISSGKFSSIVLLAILVLLRCDAVYAIETVHPKPYKEAQLLTGFTEARQTIDVSSEVGGKCLTVHGDIGDSVSESGVLAEIDTTFIRLDIQSNRLEVESTRRQLQTEKKMLARYTTLKNKNSATEAKLDEVTLKVDLHGMKIKSLNNKHSRLRETLARHTITAPSGWTIIKRMIEPGEYIQPGQVIGSVGDFSKLVIPLALSHNELRRLQQHGEISLYFPDLDLSTSGELYRVSPAYDQSTKKISVDVIIDDRDKSTMLRGGLRAEIRLLRKKAGAFLVPSSSLIARYNAYWVVEESGEKVRVLFLGSADQGAAAIISSKGLTVETRILKNAHEDF